jgi:transcriptional regulator with XRE-family HTH domain
MSTGSIIQQLREQKNLSREAVADWLYLSAKTYERIERGERPLTLKEASILAEKYEVPLSTLLPTSETYINNGSVSVGVGSFHNNTIYCDSHKLDELISEVKELSRVINELVNDLKLR